MDGAISALLGLQLELLISQEGVPDHVLCMLTGQEAAARPSSAASSVSAASDLLSEGWPSANGAFRCVA